jgi:hypothetical protein
MYAIGDVVSILHDGSREVGEVVGVLSAPGGPLYDVSLEDIVVKATEEADLAPVHADEIRTLLTSLVGMETSVPTRRKAVLRQCYAAFLTKALDRLDREAEGIPSDVCARFEVGQSVAARDGSSLSLGVVSLVARDGESIRYEVDVLGETLRMDEAHIMALSDAVIEATYQLGSRARFVADGYEGDDAFVGTICKLEETETGIEYSLMFDDGDILEGLLAADLE